MPASSKLIPTLRTLDRLVQKIGRTASSFKLCSGELKISVKRGESGNERQQTFCPERETQIYSTPVRKGPKVHSIRLGTHLQRSEFVPKLQLWFRSSQPWVADVRAIPHFEKQRTFSGSGAIDTCSQVHPIKKSGQNAS